MFDTGNCLKQDLSITQIKLCIFENFHDMFSNHQGFIGWYN